MKTVTIAFDEQGYIMAQNKVNYKRKAFENMINVASRYVNISKKDHESIKKNPILFFENAVLQRYEGMNTLHLSFKKLVEILEMDIQPFYDAVKDYYKYDLDESKDVDRQQYEINITNKNQIDLYTDLKDFCNMAHYIKKKYHELAHLGTIHQALAGAINYDLSKNELYPNPRFILER